MARSKLPRSRRTVREAEGPPGTPGPGEGKGGGRRRGGSGRGVSTQIVGHQEDHGSPTFMAGAPVVCEPSRLTDGSSNFSSIGTEITDAYPESDGAWRIPSRQSSTVDPRRTSIVSQDEVDMAVVRITKQQEEMNGTWIRSENVDDEADKGHVDLNDVAIRRSRNDISKREKSRNGGQLAKLPSKEGHKLGSQKTMRFTVIDLLLNLVSIGSYLADVGSDLFLAYMYYSGKNWWWFGLTLAFVFIPSTIMTIFSLKWYIADEKAENDKPKSSPIRWASRITFLVLQLAPVLRYIDTVIYGIRSRQVEVHDQKRHWYDQMLFEDTDSAMLRLFECFMEAAPQLCLQLYIMCVMGPGGNAGQGLEGPFYHLIVVGQVLSALTSMVSIAWAMCAYHRSLRLSLYAKLNMSYPGVGVQFLWHFFTIGSRIIAISLFASYFNHWVFVLAGAHWCAMLVWIIVQNTTFCKEKWEEFFFDVVAACVYIFCYLNLTEGHTRLRYLFYYTVVYSENAAMILAWYLFTQTQDIWYHSYALAAVLLGFALGVVFQIFYYLKLHPNNRSSNREKWIPLWRPLHELVGDQGGNSTMEMSDLSDTGRRNRDGPHSPPRNVNNRYQRGEDSDSTDCGRPLMGDIC